MMRFLVILSVLLFGAGPVHSAKYAGEPFSLGVGGRALAMGGASVAGPFDGSAGYWNAAGLNYLGRTNITAMHAETFGSLLNHDFVAFSRPVGDSLSRVRAYGIYLYYLGGGGIKITDFDTESGRPYVVREESHGDYMLAGSLSGKVRDIFDVGLTVRVIYRDLGTISGYGLTADVGALYHLSESTVAGLVVTDLFTGFLRYSGGYSESITPTVKPGFRLSRKTGDFTGQLSLAADMKFEGIREAAQLWLGDISIDTHLGGELSYREMLFGRVGFDRGDFTGGVGLSWNKINIDLAYLHNSYLDATFRASGGYSF